MVRIKNGMSHTEWVEKGKSQSCNIVLFANFKLKFNNRELKFIKLKQISAKLRQRPTF